MSSMMSEKYFNGDGKAQKNSILKIATVQQDCAAWGKQGGDMANREALFP